MPKPTKEEIIAICEAAKSKFTWKSQMAKVGAVRDLALLSLTAMEGEGVEVPELGAQFDPTIGWLIVSADSEDGRLPENELREVIRRNNAEPVLRAQLHLAQAELTRLGAQPSNTRLKDERDMAVAMLEGANEECRILRAQVEEIRKGFALSCLVLAAKDQEIMDDFERRGLKEVILEASEPLDNEKLVSITIAEAWQKLSLLPSPPVEKEKP